MAKIRRLTIENYRGIPQDIDLALGDVTIICGDSGTGKTALMQSIEVLLTNNRRRGNLCGDGGEKAWLRLETDDGLTVERELASNGKSKPPLVEVGGVPVAQAPQAYLDDLVGTLTLNPVDFYLLPPKQQSQTLLSVTPMCVGWPAEGRLPGVDYTAHPLLVAAEVEGTLFKQRTDLGKLLKDAKSRMDDRRRRLPVGFAEEQATAAEALDATAINRDLVEARATNDGIDRLGGIIDRRGDKIKEMQEMLAALESEQAQDQEKFRALGNPVDTSPLEKKLGSFSAQKQALSDWRELGTAKQEVTTQEAQYNDLTQRIEAVRALPPQWLKSAELPIEGFGVNEKQEVTINGKLLEDLSDGEKIILGVQVAELLAGEIKTLTLDGLERVGPKYRKTMVDETLARGMQVIATFVTAGPLIIKESLAEAEAIATA
jgi:energy-coupling factor transporter ATP-binding protein EcfA2